mmetsp:Transcript_44458/g.128479  ORF Transcript_44458/g.128479 Transcript_44458/m.128479 type:complete len:698 (-) Transcript_44458:5-2098(-)
MVKKKGAVAAKARARKEAAKSVPAASCPAEQPSGRVLLPDGCRPQKGLKNLGNTCYMNSILQCLNASAPFSDEMISRRPPVSGGMSSALATVFSGIRGVDEVPGSSSAFDPKPLQQQLVSRFPWFRGKEQQDAHEFLRTLLGSVSDEFDEAKRGAEGSEEVQDRVARHFAGRFCVATLCWRCSRITLRLDPFLDVSLHLPALPGQQLVGAMGVTSAMAAGEEEPPPGGEADHEDEEAEERASSSKKAKGRKGRSADAPAAPAVVQPKRAKPRGVWGAAQERSEIVESTRIYVGRLVLRLLQAESGAEAEEQEEAAPEVTTFEIELERASRQKHPQWGFQWSETKCKEEEFVLCGVVEDSIIERWNLKRRAMGDHEQIVCIGDRLLEVNGESDYKEMSKVLRAADKVSLKLARNSVRPDCDLGRAQAESDGEQERKEQEKAKKDALRRDFCDSARLCHESLPRVLADIFGPQPAHAGASDRISLEQCLHNFSMVEALEDDYKPVYACAGCAKEDVRRTYASRRMWLWPGGLPPLLTLQLKRFRRYRDRFEKSSASISLPLSLDLGGFALSEERLDDLRPFVDRGLEVLQGMGETSLKYELYGVCVHQGTSMKSGHYIAFVNGGPSLDKENWFEISDAKRKSCSRAEVLKAEAYVAFYRREGTGVEADEAVATGAEASPSRHGRADDEEEDDGGGGDGE